MVNQQTLSGNWNSIKGEIRKKWSQLTNEDLQAFNGNVEHLIGSIQKRTGEAREAIEQFLDEATQQGRQGVAQAADVVRNYAAGAATQARQYVGEAIEAVEEGSQEAYDAVRQGYRQAENTIRSRPAEAAAVCFCAGILTGLMLAVTLRTR